jgi:PKD repeat protein
MSELRTSPAFIFVTVLLIASMSPLLMAAAAQSSESDRYEAVPYDAGGVIIGDISEFDAQDGREYLFIEEDEIVVSASSFMKLKWVEAGMPGVDEMLMQPSTSGRSSARACSPHVVGDTLTVPTSGGSVDTYVAKTTVSVAFLVQSGRTLSSTVLNNLAQTWDQTIYPTMTTYYGKDYQDGRGLAPPDKDNNCQIQIVIYDIDGAYNIGGYFSPSFAVSREAVFVDYADVTLTWGKSIIAHELEHLLHNAQDPYENLWIDEGNADVAIYLCFGADSTLTGHVNAWTTSPDLSVRWWNQRIADYGAGYMFTMYLAEHLGGGPAVRQLVQDSATGGQGVVNLALSPQSGQSGKVGTTMSEIFANFSIAATLDSDQGIWGYPNLQLTQACASGSFCRAQPADTNSDWVGPWSSTGNSVEGWGISSYKFTPGAASPAPLTMRFTADVSQFEGVLVSKSTVDGLWSVSDLNFQNNVATGLIPGFGNLTDEVWAITWYASTVADCDYTSCGSSYPQGTIDVEAARITSPATIGLNTTTLSDRDGDGSPDTAHINYNVLSNAFFEDLDVTVKVKDGFGNEVDSLTNRISAGGGVDVGGNVYFTAAMTDQYTFDLEMRDMLGTLIDTKTTSPQTLANMRPTANGSIAPNQTQTWENVQFNGDGFDAWGLSLDNNSLPYYDSPTAYAWDFGDNISSSLKSPVRYYTSVGTFNATLRIQDVGGTWSETDIHEIVVNDTTQPVPIITVNNVVIETEISIMTNQKILFSAGRTADNVPTENLQFDWNWGDGTSQSGVGMYSAHHEWGALNSTNETYNLTLSVSDGINLGTKSINVTVNNRVPVQIWSENMTTYTYTPMVMPDVFKDYDGQIVSYAWSFPDGVNLNGGSLDRTDDFTTTSSAQSNPIVGWDNPGLMTVQLTVTDDDGSSSTAQFYVTVLNQMPVSDFLVRTTASTGSELIDFRATDGQVDSPYTFDGRNSFDPDGTVGDSSDLTFNWSFSDGTFGDRPQVTHSFAEPGVNSVILIVTDESGQESIAKTMVIRISNPVPIISVKILDAWLGGEIITDETSFPEGTVVESWSRTFDEDGNSIAAPGTLLYFDSEGTRDGDRRYEGMYIPLESSSPEWNGIVSYTWDFGDATPLNHDPSPWHSYSIPGEYIVTLTVRDSFGTGDVSRQSYTVIIDTPPVIEEIYIPEDVFVGDVNSLNANVTGDDSDELIIYRDLNVLDGSISDRDERIESGLLIQWDLDLAVDANENGDFADDWVLPLTGSRTRVSASWQEAGLVPIRLQVCNGLDMCDEMDYDVQVIPEGEAPPSLSDFSVQDWKNWLADAGSDLLTFIVLITAALILGWFVMREPTEVEEEAKKAAETYDVEHVESQGGLLGMDQHAPPPAPSILSKEERRSDDSGYVRPLRRRG